MKNAELKTSQPSVPSDFFRFGKGICPFVYFYVAVLFQANRFQQIILCTVKSPLSSALTVSKDPQSTGLLRVENQSNTSADVERV